MNKTADNNTNPNRMVITPQIIVNGFEAVWKKELLLKSRETIAGFDNNIKWVTAASVRNSRLSNTVGGHQAETGWGNCLYTWNRCNLRKSASD